WSPSCRAATRDCCRTRPTSAAPPSAPRSNTPPTTARRWSSTRRCRRGAGARGESAITAAAWSGRPATMRTTRKRRRWLRGGGAFLLALCASLCLGAPAQAASTDPLFVFSPVPPPPQIPPLPHLPPTGYLNGSCGVTVDLAGRPWVSDYYHRSLGVFSTGGEYDSQPLAAFNEPEPHTGPLDDPCGLVLDSSGTLYVNNYHRNVARF